MSDQRAGLVAALDRLAQDARSGRTSTWENVTLPEYLEALAAWLRVYEHAYTNRGEPVPDDIWEVMTAAVNAATIYE
jgi:hypothetical protein